jgi:hypothetical protein
MRDIDISWATNMHPNLHQLSCMKKQQNKSEREFGHQLTFLWTPIEKPYSAHLSFASFCMPTILTERITCKVVGGFASVMVVCKNLNPHTRLISQRKDMERCFFNCIA